MEEKKPIKIINTYNVEYDNIVNDENLIYNNWWYLHGDLCEIFGYDKASCYEAPEEYVKNTYKYSKAIGYKTHYVANVRKLIPKKELYINDIIPVKVYGIDEECIGYFWTSEEQPLKIYDSDNNITESIIYKQRGLVCLKSDEEANREALQHYKDKSIVI